jgi:NAD(P)-dependent dehydrogenase (short-subunit alcohol dehydrogenase family)
VGLYSNRHYCPGVASGIGRATIHAFADEGVTRFVLADINLSDLETVKAKRKNANANAEIHTVLVKTYTSVESDVQRMVDEGVKTFGAIHYYVNNAGVTSTPRAWSHELPVAAWDRVQGINLRGVWLCQRAEITQILK